MISRVAENCFWLFRYVERVESMARILGVNRTFVLDLELPELDRWRPLIIVSGEQKRFNRLHSSYAINDEKVVEDYLVWNSENPTSIRSSARSARENARVIREVISEGMWECLNGFWHWLNSSATRREFERGGDTFYREIVDYCHLLLGISHNTLLHEEPFDFMRLGMLFERAGQTARFLDVKHHAIGPARAGLELPEEIAHWSALLQSCDATEVFLKRFGGVLNRRCVIEFLVLDPRFPRSIRHCVDRAWNFIERVRPSRPRAMGSASAKALDGLRKRMRGTTVDEILDAGLHRELTRTIAEIATVCDLVHSDYFDPPLGRMRRRTRTSRAKGATA